MKTRGQQALEYLVTYGWALLVIVIVAALLWYFGVFNPTKWTAERQCGGFASFSCNAFKLNSAADATLENNTFSVIVLGNKWGRRVYDVRIAAVQDTSGNAVGGALNVSNATQQLNSSELGSCTNNMTAAWNNVSWSTNMFSAEAGRELVCHFFTNQTGLGGDSSDQITIVLYFTDGTGTRHTDAGFIKGKWE
ncbi:MAG: hypothetical protein AB1626_06085 [Candidatus Micrarchaeota archaeon]